MAAHQTQQSTATIPRKKGMGSMIGSLDEKNTINQTCTKALKFYYDQILDIHFLHFRTQ